jgi:hypothetical protein
MGEAEQKFNVRKCKTMRLNESYRLVTTIVGAARYIFSFYHRATLAFSFYRRVQLWTVMDISDQYTHEDYENTFQLV